MPERTPEVEGRVSLAAKDGSPSSAFNDTAMVSVSFLKNTDVRHKSLGRCRSVEVRDLALLSSET
jgi:hypothetical protein